MKKLTRAISITAMMSASIGAAMAADLSPGPPVVMRAAVPVSDWSGFYFGINGGWGWSSPTAEPGLTINVPGITVVPIFAPPSLSGGVFGGHAGYNIQSGPWVGGVEIDGDVAHLSHTQTTIYAPFGVPVSATLGIKVNDLGSARARVGIAPVPWLMAYATGGVGWANSSVSISFARAGFGGVTDEADQDSIGFVVGFGVETMFGQHFLFRGEYLYYDFGTQSINFPNSAALFVGNVLADSNVKTTISVARGALSYKF